jgi:hypothetical protein
LSSDSPGDNYLYVLALTANGWTHRVYIRDIPLGEYTYFPGLNNQGYHDWGDFADQWTSLAFLYELYRVNQFGFSWTPATFAGFGSSAGTMFQRDPTGTTASIIREGTNLPGDLVTAISDANTVKVMKPLQRFQAA